MPQPRVLTFNFHEPYICMMARMGLPLNVGLYESGPLARPWHSFYRPLPQNCTLVPEAEWRARLEARHYDVLVAHNEMNALDVFRAPCSKLLVCHNRRSFLSTSVTIDVGDPVDKFNELLERLQHFYEFIFISPSKQQDYDIPGRVILPGIDVEEWGGYTGEERAVLRVGNLMRERNLMFDVDFQEAAIEGLPNRVIGLNPNIPGSSPAESFEALRDAFRRHRCLLHVSREAFEDGYNLSMLEAMACGMPVVALANISSPITDGVDGYVGYGAKLLKERLQSLLDHPDLAKEIGARGRETVARRFPLERFAAQWRQAIEEAAERGATIAPKAPEPKQRTILIEYVSSPFTTARYLEKAARVRHHVMTAGFRLPETVLKDWGFPMPAPEYPRQQLDLPFSMNYTLLRSMLPPDFQPDLLLWVDSGQEEVPEDITTLPFPKVMYIIDSHIATDTRIAMARHFDVVFLAQRAQIDQFRAAGIRQVFWLPLACDPELHFVGELERRYDVSYVGSLSPNEGDRRRLLMQRVAERFPKNFIGRAWPADMARIYAQSKIVVNACHNRDVNMRVFEAMASGTLLITDEAEGLEDWFEPGKHLVVYHNDEEVFDLIEHYLLHDAERERIARAGQALVLRNHTYNRRMQTLLSTLEPLLPQLAEDKPPPPPKIRSYYMNVRREVMQHVPHLAQRVLDVGCGAGALGHTLKLERGVQEVVGVEIIESAYLEACQVLDKVFFGSIEELELPYPDGHFDCIICADVLEHLVEPEQALAKLKRVLHEDGILVISIPNIRFHGIIGMLSQGGWTYMDAGIMDSTHFRFFTKQTLPDFVARGGLEMVQIHSLNGVPPYQVPREPDGSLKMGRVTLLEVDDDEHRDLLTIQYAVLAGHPRVDRLRRAKDALAQQQYESAIALAVDAVVPEEAERLHLLAQIFTRMQQLDKAEEFLRSSLKQRHDPEVLGELGTLLIARNRPAEGLKLLEQAGAELPESDAIAAALGLALSGTERALEAFTYLERALTSSFEYSGLIKHFCDVAKGLGRLAETEPVLTAYLDYYPAHAELLCEYAALLVALNRPEEAREPLDTLLMLHPNHEQGRALLAQVEQS